MQLQQARETHCPACLFSDAFQDLGDISQFAEKNPKWIHDVIKPMFEEVKKQATRQPAQNSTGDKKGPNPNRKDVGTEGDQSGPCSNKPADDGKDKAPHDDKPEKLASLETTIRP